MRDYRENTVGMESTVAFADAQKIVEFLLEEANDVPAPTRQEIERAVSSLDPVVRAATLKALLQSQSPMDYRGDALYRVSNPLVGVLAKALGEDRDALADRILDRARPSDFSRSASAIAGIPPEYRDSFNALLKAGWRFLGAAAMTSEATLRKAEIERQIEMTPSTIPPSLRLVSGNWYLFGRPTNFDDSAFTELRASHESALQALVNEAIEEPIVTLELAADNIEFVSPDVFGRGVVTTSDYTTPPSPATAADRHGFCFQNLDSEAPPEVRIGATRRRWFGSPSLDWLRIRTGW
jgi:hypothetical protein